MITDFTVFDDFTDFIVSIVGTIYKPLLFLKFSSIEILSTELFISINLDGISS